MVGELQLHVLAPEIAGWAKPLLSFQAAVLQLLIGTPLGQPTNHVHLGVLRLRLRQRLLYYPYRRDKAPPNSTIHHVFEGFPLAMLENATADCDYR